MELFEMDIECLFAQLREMLKEIDSNTGPVVDVLDELTKRMKNSESRWDLMPHHWEIISNLCRHSENVFIKNETSEDDLNFLAELFRFIRNSCAGLPHHVNKIMNDAGLFQTLLLSLTHFIHKESNNEILVLKICLQLFGNILATDKDSKCIIFPAFCRRNILKELLKHPEPSIQEYATMIIFNCRSPGIMHMFLNTPDGKDTIVSVLDALANSSDWGILFVEYLLKNEEFLNQHYTSLPLRNRLDILCVAEQTINTQKYRLIPVTSLDFFTDMFIGCVSNPSNLLNNSTEPAEVIQLSNLLCQATLSDHYLTSLQRHENFLATCVRILSYVHLLGKQGNKLFEAASSMEDNSSRNAEEVSKHPYFSFKRVLIRLIGNLCYSDIENQDIVRELDGIPLILDCCKLDAKNPYIIQWCVLAIRNLLEKNTKNQEIIAAMSKTRDVEDSNVLQDLGFHVYSESGVLRLKYPCESSLLKDEPCYVVIK